MCGLTLGNLGLGAQVAGGIGQTYASYRKSAGEKQGYEYQAAVARNNAQLDEWQAQDAITRGGFTKNQIQLRKGNIQGKQEAIFGGRNIALNEGSALNILADTAFMGARDVAIAGDNAEKEAWALRNKAAFSMSNADFLQYRADSENPLLSSAGTALTSGGRVASSWYAISTKRTGSGSTPTWADTEG